MRADAGQGKAATAGRAEAISPEANPSSVLVLLGRVVRDGKGAWRRACAMATKDGRKGCFGRVREILGQWRRSLVAKVLVTAAMFAVIPLFVYSELASADRERNALLLEAGHEQGRVLAAALSPNLRAGPAELLALNDAIAALASDRLNVRVIFRPAGATDAAFYYVASYPSVAAEYMESERDRLTGLGILQHLERTCDDVRAVAIRHRFGKGVEHVISSITPVRTEAGCWAVIASYGHERFVRSSLGKAYWQTAEVQIAAVLYCTVAVFAVIMLLRVRDGLLRFGRVAANVGPYAGARSLAAQNQTPELDAVAAEFDRIVERVTMLSFAVENSPVAVTVAASDWRIVYVNPAFCRLTGFEEGAALGRTPADLLAGEDESARWQAIARTVEGGATWHGDIEAHRGDRTTYWADMSVYRLDDAPTAASGGSRRFVVVQQDLSERRAILTKLVAARDRAEEANRSKSQFLARMSHELRTPLNAIMGFSEVLAREDMPASLQARRRDYARHIHESGAHLLAVVNDLLDLAKLEAGKTELHLEPVDLRRLVSATVGLVAPQANAARVRLVWDEATVPVLALDERAIRQILLNLLSNAIKYTPPLGAVTVRLGETAQTVELAVVDTGCGISAEDLPRVVEPYAQVEGTARAREGTGLGLPIVKRLVELHGATMAIESEVGAGTTVCLRFPLLVAAEEGED